MASLQRFTSHGRTYWRLVESYRRPDGRPAIRTLAHLGRPDDLLARLRGADTLRVHSVSCGAVDALWHLAQEFDLPGQIDTASLIEWGRKCVEFKARTAVQVILPGRGCGAACGAGCP